jgi:hypothetical protein
MPLAFLAPDGCIHCLAHGPFLESCQPLFFFLAVLGLELRASPLLGRCSYHLSESTSPVLCIFETGSQELFVQTGLEV